jgi:hypothetical protein
MAGAAALTWRLPAAWINRRRIGRQRPERPAEPLRAALAEPGVWRARQRPQTAPTGWLALRSPPRVASLPCRRTAPLRSRVWFAASFPAGARPQPSPRSRWTSPESRSPAASVVRHADRGSTSRLKGGRWLGQRLFVSDEHGACGHGAPVGLLVAAGREGHAGVHERQTRPQEPRAEPRAQENISWGHPFLERVQTRTI